MLAAIFRSTDPSIPQDLQMGATPRCAHPTASALREQIARTWSHLIWAESFPDTSRAVSFFDQLSGQTRQMAKDTLLLTSSKVRDRILKGAISLHWRNGACKDDALTHELATEVARIWTHPCSEPGEAIISKNWLLNDDAQAKGRDPETLSRAHLQYQCLKQAISLHWQSGTCEDGALTEQLTVEVARIFAEELKLQLGDEPVAS